MDKEQMIKLLDSAVAMLEPIVVSYRAVDLMASAKNNIRQVSAELAKHKPEKEVSADG